MHTLRLYALFLFAVCIGCKSPSPDVPKKKQHSTSAYGEIKGPLLSTNFKTLEELKSVVQIEYFKANSRLGRKAEVRLFQTCYGQKISGVLKTGISDIDIRKARDGSLWDRVFLALNAPYVVLKRNDLVRVFNFARRRGFLFGEGDLVFYDFAEKMVNNICDDDLAFMSPEELSEKGYINTFNHITAQAFLTTIFSERFTDFIADTHERGNMPELISGKFTKKQLADRATGPVDNYVDIINNEWGQELGKELRKKYNITRHTKWTPELLANYINDIQSYYSWAFQISFKPFSPDELHVKKFSEKINLVMGNVSAMR